MSTAVDRPRRLESEGIQTDRVLWNLSVAALCEEAVRRREGVVTTEGPLACRAGPHTGRSPNDKFGVGRRMKIADTRALIRAALAGALDAVAYAKGGVVNPDIPASCPGVPSEVLPPRCTWASGTEYDRQAVTLARMFAENFNTFEAGVSDAVKVAGPYAPV